MNRFVRDGLYAAIGGIAGYAVCVGVGFLMILAFGNPPDGYIGPGLDRWKLPGTVLGAVTFWLIAFWLPDKRKRKD